MRSGRKRSLRLESQAGFGLVDVLVGLGILSVGIVVLLGSLSSLVVGARIAEHRTVEERLARNRIEWLMAQRFPDRCQGFDPGETSDKVNGTTYAFEVQCRPPDGGSGWVEYRVTVRDPSGGSTTLSNDRAQLIYGQND